MYPIEICQTIEVDMGTLLSPPYSDRVLTYIFADGTLVVHFRNCRATTYHKVAEFQLSNEEVAQLTHVIGDIYAERELNPITRTVILNHLSKNN